MLRTYTELEQSSKPQVFRMKPVIVGGWSANHIVTSVYFSRYFFLFVLFLVLQFPKSIFTLIRIHLRGFEGLIFKSGHLGIERKNTD